VKPKPRDEYTPVEVPSGKKDDGSVDASSMKARFELFANPPPKPKVTDHRHNQPHSLTDYSDARHCRME